MTNPIHIHSATLEDAEAIAVMVGELLTEIMTAAGVQAFHFNRAETLRRLQDVFGREKYFAFVACHDNGAPVGFVTLYESYALYAEGAFGTIAEFFVRPEFRSSGIGRLLAAQAKAFGQSRGWKRLEVTTPPLPQFERTLAFYERTGFAITGGRKLKLAL
jgi:GNAT superfamily N-acetyltransferase